MFFHADRLVLAVISTEAHKFNVRQLRWSELLSYVCVHGDEKKMDTRSHVSREKCESLDENNFLMANVRQ